eukprot:SAG22_NODE_2124_length_2974_cov_13.089043_2_plen_205_part_00
MRRSLLRQLSSGAQVAPRAAARPLAPAQRCFSVLAGTHTTDDEAVAAPAAAGGVARPGFVAPLDATLKGLKASALRTRLESMPALAGADSSRGFATAADVAAAGQTEAVYAPHPVLGRFCVTAEVVVSKIFPAGFGWQGSSCIAEQAFGLEANDTMFFMVTGIGDGVGVLVGELSLAFSFSIFLIHGDWAARTPLRPPKLVAGA